MRYRIAVFFAVSLCLPGSLFAQVPSLLNYQGRLVNPAGIPVPDATYTVRFRIYDIATGDNGTPCGEAAANCLWEETLPISTRSGVYSVLLGSTTPLSPSIFSGPQRFMGVQVGTDVEMSPRSRLASVPYAFAAGALSQGLGGCYVNWNGATCPTGFTVVESGVWSVLVTPNSGAGQSTGGVICAAPKAPQGPPSGLENVWIVTGGQAPHIPSLEPCAICCR
jgi:hypothetical protein